MARDERGVQPAPQGQRRVGMFKQGNPPMAIFFEPAFDVVVATMTMLVNISVMAKFGVDQHPVSLTV
jgi:hypothetical protein